MFVLILSLLITTRVSGQRDERIAGGSGKYQIQDFPFLAHISTRQKRVFCGGSIISPVHVLTAAHCVCEKPNPRLYQVRTGSNRKNRGGQLTNITRIICHENYNNSKFEDVAILVLNKKLKFNQRSRDVPLASKDPEVRTETKLAGWGSRETGVLPDKFFVGVIEIAPSSVCQPYYPVDVTNFICGAPNDQSPCIGDSGGPLVVNETLVGIMSRGDQYCGLTFFPSLYVSVAHYADWIATKVLPQADGGKLSSSLD